MKDPNYLGYVLLVLFCLLVTLLALYLLANFNRLFKGRIRNEWLRKNAVAWLIILCLSLSISPFNGGVIYLQQKYGWWYSIWTTLGITTVTTLVGFNVTRLISENRRLQKFSFVWHKVIILFTVIALSLLINIPYMRIVYGNAKEYGNWSIISGIYTAGAVALIYAVTSYLDLQRKKKFDEKELELSRLRELKSKAELDALHSKVNPHFLYNALNSIADLSITDGKKARRMTIALADLFRYSINYSQNNYSTVRDEVAMTDVYLQIEKIRFEDQLTYNVTISDDAAHYLVPRFLLQPLVENAVKHGLKATGQLTIIHLDVTKVDEKLVITIADNGPAFPEELIPGYGVRSVFDKLDLLFPQQYEIYFANDPIKQVVVHLHKLMKNEPAV
jgi:two-component system LytT family sensor kinase